MTAVLRRLLDEEMAAREAASKMFPSAAKDEAMARWRQRLTLVSDALSGQRTAIVAALEEREELRRAVNECVAYWEGDDGYDYAGPEEALRLLMRPELAAERAAREAKEADRG